MISARKDKQLDATTMFTYSHANTPLGQSEREYYLSYFIKHALFYRTSLNYLVLNLAVADITTAVFLSPKYIFSHFITHPEGAAGTALCIALTGGITGWVGAATGVFCLVAIAVERYYAVVYPFENMEALSKRKLKV